MSDTLPAFITNEREHELNALRDTFPFRIVYAAFNPLTGEYRASAVVTMHAPNRLVREGWQVVRVR